MNTVMGKLIVGMSLSLAVVGCAVDGSSSGTEEAAEAEAVAAATKAPPGTLVVVDDPSGLESAPGGATTNSADCGGIFDPCGIVNNRTDRWLEVSRDSASSFYCDARGPYAGVAPGRNSNQSPPGFKDTDCFRSNECSVFYAGLLHPPGDWVRIRTSVFIYSLGC